MKLVKNQKGYALLVVLLMVVLFLGLSATFMAGSLSNAKQEQTVDASNQAVASAEMGVKYHSADFQREIGIIKSEIIETTQNRIKSIVDCFNSGNSTCDEQHELTALEEKVDEDMKSEYILKVYAKVAKLEDLKDIQKTPFSGEDAHYAISGTTITKQNAAEEDVDAAGTVDKVIRSLKIQLDLSGESRGTKKYLKGIFTVEVPDTFLSPSESLTIKTKTIKNIDLNYENVFPKDWPTKTCTALMNEFSETTKPDFNDCVLGPGETVTSILALIKEKGLNPEDFKVYTKDFQSNVCGNNCNSMDLEGVVIVVKDTDEAIVGSNFNSISTINLIVDGHFDPKNMNSTGKSGEIQTFIFKELTVSSNVEGPGLTNTNLLILGKNYAPNPITADSKMDFQKNITIADNGRVCFDLDKINPDHVSKLSQKVKFTIGNTTGQIIYYTSNLTLNKFILPAADGLTSAERTKLYVQGYDNYTNFLSSCGVSLSETVEEITDIPVPYVNDPIFDLDVEY
ncbi:hypothetical protein [Planomicrobium okeanokoites]|uniref:hypothetical protein n=1 Tax=Planomicrobium okeanokoites TaxID=244 RepID=UPI0035623DF6